MMARLRRLFSRVAEVTLGTPARQQMTGAVAIFLGVQIFAAAFYWGDIVEATERGEEQEQKLKEQYLAKKTQAINLDLHKQQMRIVDEEFGSLLRQLPNKMEMDALVIDINQSALGRGVRLEHLLPGREERREFYAHLPVNVRAVGTYPELASFVSDLGKLSRIIVLDEFKMVVRPSDGKLSMDGTLRTFRYVSEEEMAEFRKAARKGVAKK